MNFANSALTPASLASAEILSSCPVRPAHRRTQAHKALKCGQVLNVEHLPHIALYIGGHVAGEPVHWLNGLGVQRRATHCDNTGLVTQAHPKALN